MGEFTIFILAGGQSTRMGVDKALIEIEGQPLVGRAVATARASSAYVRIVGSVEKYSKFGDVVEDIYSECGPLGGIHAALTSTSTEYNLMLPVDMPFLSVSLLDFLAEEAFTGKAAITVPEVDGRLQPLCAAYRRDFLSIAEKSLRGGAYKITALFEQVEAKIISDEQLKRAGFSTGMFRNWNSPADVGETDFPARVKSA